MLIKIINNWLFLKYFLRFHQFTECELFQNYDQITIYFITYPF